MQIYMSDMIGSVDEGEPFLILSRLFSGELADQL